MATDKKDEAKFVKDHVVFEDDPELFCRNIYEEALEHNNELKEHNVENRLFYEGIDKKLEERANSVEVVRSALFVHLLKPAIDTRVAEVISKIDEREYPIIARPRKVNPTDEEKDKANIIARKITDQLRDCGYLSGVFKEQLVASEIYRTPSAVKIGWEMTDEKEAINQQSQGWFSFVKSGVHFEKKYKSGRPTVEWLYPDEFLYQPWVSDFNGDSQYVIHAVWLDFHEIMALAHEHGYDIDKIKEYWDAATTEQEKPEASNDSLKDKEASDRGDNYDDGYRDGKFLLTEEYVVTYQGMSRKISKITRIGNRFIIKNESEPYKGFDFPFEIVAAHPMPGTIEGLSSVDVGKGLQRLYNDIFNHHLDNASYNTFPVLKAPIGFSFKGGQPMWYPGAIFQVTEPDELQPLIPNYGQIPDLPNLMDAVAAKLRDALNAHDISQGFQSSQYEKATSTKLRALGASRRATPTHKLYGESIIKVCNKVLALNQQYADAPEDWVVDGGIYFDVPSLTSITDPETDKQEALLLLADMLQNPLYQNATGLRKIRNLTEDMYRTFRKIDIDKYVPTEEELEQIINDQTKVQTEQIEKQSIQEEMAIQQASAPQPVSQKKE